MKNFFLTEERTLGRKLQEIAMALIAERRFSKQEIFENYLNEIYLGQRHGVAVHGVWEAAEYYFGREPRELTMGQIATLAGMIRAPNYYSPHAHPERAVERRNTVLELLHQAGEIDERTLVAARAEPLGSVPPPPPPTGAPYFVDFVRRDIQGRFPGEMLTSEGYRIFTTLDPVLQGIAERTVADGIAALERDFPDRTLDRGSRLQAALIALNPRTGAVLAMVGGRDYASSQYNRAVDMRRQPGSIFKPIVYLAALGSERVGAVHYQPTTMVLDEPFSWTYDGGTWSPDNFEGRFHGPVTLRSALEQSLNAATARIAREVGLESVRDLAVRLGMTRDLPAYPSIVLGGWEASPLEVAKVYSVFANGGIATEPFAVQKVVDREGQVVQGHRVSIRKVIPAQDSFLITHLLQGVVERGTASAVRSVGLRGQVAAKTGTTNAYHDAWLAGYTPDLLAVVWVGFDRDVSLGLSGATAALPIWARFMRDATVDHHDATFVTPPGIVFALVDAEQPTSERPDCFRVIREAFLEGEAPELGCASRQGWNDVLRQGD
jgi:penicillin-binding protein 1B